MTDSIVKARDGDGDGFVHDGTPRMRPVRPGEDRSSVLGNLLSQIRNRNERGVAELPKRKKKTPAKKPPAKKAPAKKAPAKRQGGKNQGKRPPTLRKFMFRRIERALKKNPDGGAVNRALFDDNSGQRRTDKTFDMQLHEFPGFDQMTDKDRFEMVEWLAKNARASDITGRRQGRDASHHEELEWDALVEDSKNWRKPLQPRDRRSKPGRLKDSVIRRGFQELGIVPGKKRKLSQQNIENKGGERSDDRDPTGRKVVGGVGDIPMTPGGRAKKGNITDEARELGEARAAEHDARRKAERKIKRDRQAAAKAERDKGAPNRGKRAAADIPSFQQREREEGIIRTGTEGIVKPRTQSELDSERHRVGVEQRRGIRHRAAKELHDRGLVPPTSAEMRQRIDAGEPDGYSPEAMQRQRRRLKWASDERRREVDEALIAVRDSKNSDLEVALKRLREAEDAEERDIKANIAASGERDTMAHRRPLEPWLSEDGDYVYGDDLIDPTTGDVKGKRNKPSTPEREREESIVQENRKKNKAKVLSYLEEEKKKEEEEAVTEVIVSRDEAVRSFPRDQDGFIDYDKPWANPFTEVHQKVVDDEENFLDAGVLPVEYLPEDVLSGLGLSRPDPAKSDAVRAGQARLDEYRKFREKAKENARKRDLERLARRRSKGSRISEPEDIQYMRREQEYAQAEKDKDLEETERIKGVLAAKAAEERKSKGGKSSKSKKERLPKPDGFAGSEKDWNSMSRQAQLDWHFINDADITKSLSEIISKRSVVRTLLRSLKARKFREDLIRRDFKGRFADKPGSGGPKHNERGAVKNPFNRSNPMPDKKAAEKAAKKKKRKAKRELISTHIKDEFARGLKEGLEQRNERGAAKAPGKSKKPKKSPPKKKKPRANKGDTNPDGSGDTPEARRDRDEHGQNGSRRERTKETLERERSPENVEADDMEAGGSRGKKVDRPDPVDGGSDKAKPEKSDADETDSAQSWLESGGDWKAAPDIESLRGEDAPGYDEVVEWIRDRDDFKVISESTKSSNKSVIVDTPRGKRIFRANSNDERQKDESHTEALVSNFFRDIGIDSQFVTGIVGDSVLVEHLAERHPNIQPSTTPDLTMDGHDEFMSHDWADRTEFLKLFIGDYLVGNQDRHSNNWMEYDDENGQRHIVAIDNGQSGRIGMNVGLIDDIEERGYKSEASEEIAALGEGEVDGIDVYSQRTVETHLAEGWRGKDPKTGKEDVNNHNYNMLMRIGALYDGDEEALQADLDEFLDTLDPKTIAYALDGPTLGMPGFADTDRGEGVSEELQMVIFGRLEELLAGGKNSIAPLSQQALKMWRDRKAYLAERLKSNTMYPPPGG